MSNLLANWWQSRQFNSALKKGNTRLAERLLQQKQGSGAKLSLLEKLFQDQLQSAQSSYYYKTEAETLIGELKQAVGTIEELNREIKFYQHSNSLLKPDVKLIDFISNSFKLLEHDEYKLQCTDIDQIVFNDFEASLVEYLKQEFDRFPTVKLKIALKDAYEDIERLKSGQDPNYNLELTPHVYFMKYFLNNVYGAYLAWFIIYQSSLLLTNINILDIAAGPGTVAYGLALFLKSSNTYFNTSKMHISYYSLEEQATFQQRGLQFWRRYIEPHQTATNAYFRFDTTNIFNYCKQPKKIPQAFFDFIVISHCFFSEAENRENSYKVFSQIFSENLKATGHVLLIIQGRKLFKAYNINQSEDNSQESNLVKELVQELGLRADS